MRNESRQLNPPQLRKRASDRPLKPEAATSILMLRDALLDIQKRSTLSDVGQIVAATLDRLPEAYRVQS